METDIKKKKLGFRLILLGLLLIPGLLVLFVIGCNTKYLIRMPFYIIISILILLLIGGFIYGIVTYRKNKQAKSRRIRKWLKVIFSFFMTMYVVGCVAFLLLLYGPSNKFRTWLITTAMQTMNHQYLCKWFYNDEQIAKVQSENYVKESGESTDASLVKPKDDPVIEYKDEYDKEILDVKKGTKYKIIKLKINGQNAYLAAIYDPSMVKLQVTSSLGTKGEYVTKMAEKTNAMLAINGGGFSDPGNSSLGGTPNGITISNGKIVTNGQYGSSGGIIGFTNENVLVLLKNTTAQQAIDMGVRDAVSWNPFLIVNGEPSFIKGNGGWGYAARTAIGQREDGIVLFLVVDSNQTRTAGANMVDLTEIMQRYHAINAANLDGGTSSVMVLPKEIAKSEYNAPCTDYYTNYACAINDPIDSTGTHQTRFIADAWVVVDNSNDTTNNN